MSRNKVADIMAHYITIKFIIMESISIKNAFIIFSEKT